MQHSTQCIARRWFTAKQLAAAVLVAMIIAGSIFARYHMDRHRRAEVARRDVHRRLEAIRRQLEAPTDRN